MDHASQVTNPEKQKNSPITHGNDYAGNNVDHQKKGRLEFLARRPLLPYANVQRFNQPELSINSQQWKHESGPRDGTRHDRHDNAAAFLRDPPCLLWNDDDAETVYGDHRAHRRAHAGDAEENVCGHGADSRNLPHGGVVHDGPKPPDGVNHGRGKDPAERESQNQHLDAGRVPPRP